MGSASTKNLFSPSKWSLRGTFLNPNMPKPEAPPPPTDPGEPFFKELARKNVDQEMQKSRGRAGSFLLPNPPGGKGR